MIKRSWKRKLPLLLLSLLVTAGACPLSAYGDTPAFEKEQTQTVGSPKERDEGHEHEERCYRRVRKCLHRHEDGCYTEPVMPASPSDASPSDGIRKILDCSHVCSEDNGCITWVLDCTYKGADHKDSAPARPVVQAARATAEITGPLILGDTSASDRSQGWDWSANSTAQKGTLTLTDCHITSDSQVLRVPSGWEVTIVLEGENVLYNTNLNQSREMIGNTAGLSNNSWIVEGDGSLDIRSDSQYAYGAYGFTGYSVKIRSGTIRTNVTLCMIFYDFTVEGGVLEIDATTNDLCNGIYSDSGPVTISGGEVHITAGQAGIFVPGLRNGSQTVQIAGGDIHIDAATCIYISKQDRDQAITISGGSFTGTAGHLPGLMAKQIVIGSGSETPVVQVTSQAQPAIRGTESISIGGKSQVTADSGTSFGFHTAGTFAISDSAQMTATGQIDGTASSVDVRDGAVLNAMVRTDTADGRSWTVYGDATLHNDLTLGPEAFEDAAGSKKPVKRVITQGATLTVPEGITLDATAGITADTLDQYLSADEETVKQLTGEQGVVKLPGNMFQVSLDVQPTEGGTVTGDGSFYKGDQVTVTARPAAGYHFVRWMEGGAVLGTASSLTFTVTSDKALTAVFEKDGGSSGETPSPSPDDPSPDDPSPDVPAPGGSPSGGAPSGGSSSGGRSGRSADTSSSAGTWEKDDKGWRLRYPNGTYETGNQVRGEDGLFVEQLAWKYRDNAWWPFGADGYLKDGWVLDRKKDLWYHIDTEKGMQLGWYQDPQDGQWYYLDPENGHMLTGWVLIAGNWYYLNASAQAPSWSYDKEAGRWRYDGDLKTKPLGAMYRDEMTPDGYRTDGNGRWT